MIVLVLLVVIILVFGAAGMGRVAFGDPERRAERTGPTIMPMIVIGLGAAVVLLLVLPMMLFGARSSSGRDDPEPATATAGSTPAATTTTTTSPARPAVRSSALGPVVRIGQNAAPAVGELRADSVLRVIVDDFDPFIAARAKQCAGGRCGNLIAVQFNEHGSASFQYLVVDNFVPTARAGGCRRDAAPCSIVVEDVEGDRRAEIVTVFHDALPPPAQITVEPSTGLLEGETIDVRVEGGQPGARVELVLCALPATIERCGEPGPVLPLTIGSGGSGMAAFAVGRTTVGSEGVACGGGSGCAVALRSSSAFRAEPVPLTFAAPPGVAYDGDRLAIGIGVALALLLLALVLIRRTDWSPIGEEAAPAIDNAEYADLDAIIALLPPEEDDALISP